MLESLSTLAGAEGERGNCFSRGATWSLIPSVPMPGSGLDSGCLMLSGHPNPALSEPVIQRVVTAPERTRAVSSFCLQNRLDGWLSASLVNTCLVNA